MIGNILTNDETIFSIILGLKTSERISVQDQWSKGECPCVCATVSFGMGVDKASVRAVVHWGVPQNVAAYYQVSIFYLVVLFRFWNLLLHFEQSLIYIIIEGSFHQVTSSL